MKKEITVTTRDALKKAQAEKYDVIYVEGKLAQDVKDAQVVTKLGKGALAVLSAGIAAALAGIAAAPATGGASVGLTVAAAAPIAVTTGLSIPAIVLISVLGVSAVIAMFRDYDVEVDVSARQLRVILRRR